MKKILNIVSSANGKASLSRKLSDVIIEKLVSTYPGSSVYTHDLALKPYPHLEEVHITSFYTPEEVRTEENKQALKNSDQAIKEVMEADIIVIAAPLYNFSVPSTLKAWIDHIVRGGVTFKYTNGLPEGLVLNKKVYLSISSGGVYSEGPMKAYDFSEPYLRAVLGFIGMKDLEVFRVEGTNIPDLKNTALEKAIDSVNAHAFDAVVAQV